MPIISFANPKGGAGKTTSALLLAGELAARGARVAIIDADPEKWISQWGRLPGKPDNVTIQGDVSEDSIVDLIETAAADAQFVIVDLEGTASLMVANAIGMSDLVVIPAQGASMDAKGAAKTIKLIRNQERMARRPIPHSVLLTRTSAAVVSRALKNVREQLDQAGIDVFQTAIVERAAYRDIFDYGGLLADLGAEQVSNVEKARDNAREFAGEVIAKLKQAAAAAKVA
ncbi:MAG: ParA family protein [Alicycliphilus sp.]|jgi:chromosome partitioning protein|nr:MAG: ParA family protein [Alicycliphilus sp.]